MKKTFLPLIMGFLLLFASSATHATIKYVKANAAGLNNGTSWANAYTDLQSALTGTYDTVWVANGVYKPTATTNRAISFNISGRKLYGGFVGTEVNLSDRNYSSFQTILSGDIGVVGDSTDNTESVVVGNNSSIDGFLICLGYNDNGGAGGINSMGDVYIYNCCFNSNYSLSNGGALIATGSTFVDHCEFNNNVAGSKGGAIATSTYSQDIHVSNSKITGNKAVDGGAIYVGTGGITFDRCIISNNAASNSGGVVFLRIALPNQFYIQNSLVVGNFANTYSVLKSSINGLSNGNSYQTIRYCTIADNKANIGGSCIDFGLLSIGEISGTILWNNGSSNAAPMNVITGAYSGSFNMIQIDPQFINSGNFLNAPFDAFAYNYRLQSTSPAIDASIATIAVSELADLSGYLRSAIGPWDAGCYDHCTTSLSGTITGPDVICPGVFATLTAPATSGAQYLWNTGSTANSISVDTSGLYILNVNSGNGCSQSFLHLLTVSKPISIYGNSILCFNAQKTLSISDTTGFYTWNNGSTAYSITANDTGVYYVSGTNIAGCFSSDTIHLIHPSTQAYVTITGNSVICPGSLDTLMAQGNLNYYTWNDQNFTTDQTLIISQSGTYRVGGSDSFGCPIQDSFYVQQGTTPLIMIAGDSILCPNNSITLTASGDATHYIWSNADTTQIITINDSAIYYVTGKNNMGCTAADTFHVQMGELPIPTISQTGSAFSTATTFTSYQWYKDNVAITGATQQQYTATQSGSYSVKVTNINGCEGASNTLSYTPTGINGVNKNSNLNIYPNPANKYAIIDLENLSDKINSYSIVDIWGRVIESHSDSIPNGKTLKIDLQNVAAGSYYITLQGVQQQYLLKVTIVK
jgi:predicted outer membrane repeat protein